MEIKTEVHEITFVDVANIINKRAQECLISEIVKEETVLEGDNVGRESMDRGSANDDDKNLETDPIAIGHDNRNEHCMDEKNGTLQKIIRQPVKIKIKKERTNEDESDHSEVSDEESTNDQKAAMKVKTEPLHKEEQDDKKKVVNGKSRKNAHTKSAQGSAKRNIVNETLSTEKSIFDMAAVSKTADTRGCLFTCSKCSES